ncbi:MAG: Ppx/GppA phosphatase family protein [Pseudomonadota bacterium]
MKIPPHRTISTSAEMPAVASLDLGSNTFRLLIGRPLESGFRPLLVENRITRLGENLKEGGLLYPPAAERSLEVLLELRSLMDAHQVSFHRAVGTSALRRAKDAAVFAGRAWERAGIRVEVIDGLEEARLTVSGVFRAVGERAGRVVVLDVGGGSTEFIVLEDGKVLASRSLEMGVVRLTEALLRHDPPERAEVAALRAGVTGRLSEVARLVGQVCGGGAPRVIIGTAGTPTTVAAILQGLAEYRPERINGYVLRLAELEALLSRLAAVPAAERLRWPGLTPGREDIIIAGVCILLETMIAFRSTEVVVSDGGLLEGVLQDLLAEPSSGAALSPLGAC